MAKYVDIFSTFSEKLCLVFVFSHFSLLMIHICVLFTNISIILVSTYLFYSTCSLGSLASVYLFILLPVLLITDATDPFDF